MVSQTIAHPQLDEFLREHYARFPRSPEDQVRRAAVREFIVELRARLGMKPIEGDVVKVKPRRVS